MEQIYTFKEVCDKTGYRPSAIRYYEKEFELNISRDVNGRRIFYQADLERLLTIKRLQSEGYNNSQIKRILNEGNITTTQSEVAITLAENSVDLQPQNNLLQTFDLKLQEINNMLQQLNQNITSKDRDVLLSENAKLKMELKQKSYEIIELKEKLRYERERKKGFWARFFNRK